MTDYVKILYRLWTCDRACVLTFRKDVADRFAAKGGRVTGSEYHLELEGEIDGIDAAPITDEWIARWEALP